MKSCMVHHDLIRSRSCGPRSLWFKTPCWTFKKVVSSTNSRHELYLFGTHRTFAYIIHTDIMIINLVIVNVQNAFCHCTSFQNYPSGIDQLQCSSSKVRVQIESRYNMRCQRYHWRIWMWQSQLDPSCVWKKTMELPKSQVCEMSTTCVVLLILELFANQIWMIGFSNHVKQLFSDDWWHIIHVSKQTWQEATHWGDAWPRKWLKPNKSRCRTRRKSVLSFALLHERERNWPTQIE